MPSLKSSNLSGEESQLDLATISERINQFSRDMRISFQIYDEKRMAVIKAQNGRFDQLKVAADELASRIKLSVAGKRPKVGEGSDSTRRPQQQDRADGHGNRHASPFEIRSEEVLYSMHDSQEPIKEQKEEEEAGQRSKTMHRSGLPDIEDDRDDRRPEYDFKEMKEIKSMLQVANYCGDYSYSELQAATNNFHESFKLGEGGFGIVYKGILHNTTVAIKMLKDGSNQGAKEFNQEIEILSEVRHPNLVKLIGACAETHALIYEYLPNGSLEDRMRCKNNTSPLSWQARVQIALEICSALSFLHCSKPHGIVHGDLKPDNVLLDANDTSKICDFGLCCELNYTASASIPYHWTDCPKGTLAYMDPEYFSTGKITPQFDVYSFGIILLRLATCKSPMGIRQLVEEAQKKGTLKALIDASAGNWPFKEAKKMISLGLRCSDPMRKNRPDLSTKVWKELKSMADVASASVSS